MQRQALMVERDYPLSTAENQSLGWHRKLPNGSIAEEFLMRYEYWVDRIRNMRNKGNRSASGVVAQIGDVM